VVGPGRSELSAAVGPPSVVTGLILGQDQPQASRSEDQHPVGDLGPDGEHEPLRISVRPRTSGRDLHRLDTGTGQGRIEGLCELPSPVAYQEPEIFGAVTEVPQEVPICWVVHGPSGFAVTPRTCM
jgi:hypothetical protein